MTSRKGKVLHVHIPDDLWSRINAIADALLRDRDVRIAFGRMTRSTAVRIAMIEGLRVIEKRYEHLLSELANERKKSGDARTGTR